VNTFINASIAAEIRQAKRIKTNRIHDSAYVLEDALALTRLTQYISGIDDYGARLSAEYSAEANVYHGVLGCLSKLSIIKRYFSMGAGEFVVEAKILSNLY
jgi:hypothetical protein